MSVLSGWRAGGARDALLVLARDANRAGVQIPDLVRQLIGELHGEALAADRISEVGTGSLVVETIDHMRTHGTPDEAGQAVGMTGRNVRNLCAKGLVAHCLIGGGRYLVDVEDLQRHLRGDVA